MDVHDLKNAMREGAQDKSSVTVSSVFGCCNVGPFPTELPPCNFHPNTVEYIQIEYRQVEAWKHYPFSRFHWEYIEPAYMHLSALIARALPIEYFNMMKYMIKYFDNGKAYRLAFSRGATSVKLYNKS